MAHPGPPPEVHHGVSRLARARRNRCRSAAVPFAESERSRSITSHIRSGKAVDTFDEIAPNPVNKQDNAEDFVEQIPTQAPIDPERQLLAHDLDKQIRERFKDDPLVLLVLKQAH